MAALYSYNQFEFIKYSLRVTVSGTEVSQPYEFTAFGHQGFYWQFIKPTGRDRQIKFTFKNTQIISLLKGLDLHN